MKNLVVTVILVGVLGYFGAKFYLHHEVSSNLDALRWRWRRPFADIQYDGVSSTMSGELSIDGINARFGNFTDRLEIDKVSIITPGFLYLLNLGEMGEKMSGSEAELPESFGFAIEGMRVDVSDDFMKELSRAAREASPKIDEDDTAGECVGKYGFSMETLRRLGYNDLVINLSMGYEQGNGNLLFDMWTDIEDMYGVKVEMTLAGTLTPQLIASRMYKPRMVDARIEYEDYSLIERTRALCKRQGLSEDDVIAAEMDAFQTAGLERRRRIR